MIKVTPDAAMQMRAIASQTDAEGLLLRLAVEIKENGSFHYLMGFDECSETDLQFESNGVTVICAPDQDGNLDGTTIDYVELEAGEMHFIFSNPNDPAYSPGG